MVYSLCHLQVEPVVTRTTSGMSSRERFAEWRVDMETSSFVCGYLHQAGLHAATPEEKCVGKGWNLAQAARFVVRLRRCGSVILADSEQPPQTFLLLKRLGTFTSTARKSSAHLDHHIILAMPLNDDVHDIQSAGCWFFTMAQLDTE